jgi:hypothetical protein
MLLLAPIVLSVRSHTAHKISQSATAVNLLAPSSVEYLGSHEPPRALGHEEYKTNHFMSEASFILARSTCHNWLVISAVMNLTRTTAGTEAHGEVWHTTKQGLEGLHVIPADKHQNMYL